MKKAFNIAFVYIGLVIGAGFASGREILEYFSLPSQTSPDGVAFAAIAFGVLGYIIMSLSKKMNIYRFVLFIKSISPSFSLIVRSFMYAFMFSGFFVMLSAAGTLFEESFNLPFGLGVLVISLLCFVVFSFDVKGLVLVNSILVPLMIFGIIILCFISASGITPAFFSFSEFKKAPLVSALCYVSYNTITLGAVLVPLSENADKKTIRLVSFISGGILGLIIFLIWFSMNLYFKNLLNSPMPLLEMAAMYGKMPETIFAVVLFMALSTTAISHGFGLLEPFRKQSFRDRVLISALLCLSAMPFSYLGFSLLVSKLYFAFGILGLFWTGMLLYKFLKGKPL